MLTELSRLIFAFRKKLGDALGYERVGPIPQLTKLKDEVGELEADILAGKDMLPELADCLIVLLMLGASRDITADEITQAAEVKMRINMLRDWFPTSSGTARHTPE